MWLCSLPDGSVDKMRKGSVETKKGNEMTPDKPKERERQKTQLSAVHPQLSLREKSREGNEENIFQRQDPLLSPLCEDQFKQHNWLG